MAKELAGIVKKSFTVDTFDKYIDTVVAKNMAVWRPMGVVIHNTGKHSKWTATTTAAEAVQYMRNMSVTWDNAGWSSGPHLVIGPCGNIVCATPLWLRGTHSPSWNSTHWGIEMVGDFDFDPFGNVQRDAVTIAIASLFQMLGRTPDDSSIKLHKEDPKTSHKRCPGKNSGTKAAWISRIKKAILEANGGELSHVHAHE